MSSEIEEASRLSAAEVGRRVANGRLDPRALAEHLLEKAAAHTGSVESGAPRASFVRLTRARAKREAAAAYDRARRGMTRSPLDGVPTSWKDLFDMAGERTEAGAPKIAGRVAEYDAELVARGGRAGLVSIGKTHLSELAFSGLGYNGQTATAPNRYDPEAVPGGSSSGAAASVALELCAGAVGSDTGGSVRIPSAWNGLVGLKTTAGLLPMDGVAPLSPTLDTVGPLCRTVEDAALFLSILSGAKPADLAGASARGVRLLAAEGLALEGMTGSGREGYGRALELLRSAGARVDAFEPPEFPEALETLASQGAIVNTEGYAIWGEALEAQPDAISPMVLSRFRSGKAFRADQIEKARLTLKRLQASFLAGMAGADAVILPSVANRAPSLEMIAKGGEAAMAENLLALRNTRLGNVLGLCALAIPAGIDKEGAPVSLMLFGHPFEEKRLLRLGAAFERALAPQS